MVGERGDLLPEPGGNAIARLRKTRMMLSVPSKMAVARTAGRAARCRDELVLGIDPGLQRTGYALLSEAPAPQEARLIEAGVIRLRRADTLAARLVELETSLETLIRAHQPALLACEELYAHYKHPRTAILMAHARGVILALAARRGLRIVSVAATNVKKLLRHIIARRTVAVADERSKTRLSGIKALSVVWVCVAPKPAHAGKIPRA